MTINAEVLKALGVSSQLAERWGPEFEEQLPEYEINTPLREKHFVSQVLHESGMLKHTKENLNYSADALQRVFKKYFPTRELAEEYARQPEKIANRVYANRMGNGNEASGDGWGHRGDGFIQLTGANNQNAYRLWSGESGPIDPLLSALYYWSDNDLNRYADQDDVKKLTRAINGGYNGLEHRTLLASKLAEVLGIV